MFAIFVLKRNDNSWERIVLDKAELFAYVLGLRYVLHEATNNVYTWTAYTNRMYADLNAHCDSHFARSVSRQRDGFRQLASVIFKGVCCSDY